MSTYYHRQVIPQSAIPRIAYCARVSCESIPQEWLRACRISGKVAAEIKRQAALHASRAAARKTSRRTLGERLISRAEGRWSALVDQIIPYSRGAGTHAGAAVIRREEPMFRLTTPYTSYDTYRGKAPCKAYDYATACSTATVHLPVGWEIVEEDHATVARRARWHARTMADRQERYMIRQRGAYGLRANRGWYIAGKHIEIADRARALRQAHTMTAARRAAQAEQRAWLGLYGAETMTLADSVAAGNCRIGSEGWARKWLGGRLSATIAEVMRAGRRSGERRAELAARVAARRVKRELDALALMSAVS